MLRRRLKRLKDLLPKPLQILAAGALHYIQRLGRWTLVLREVRGVGFGDSLKLVLSAIAALPLSFKNLLEWQNPVLLFDVKVKIRSVGRFDLRRMTDDLYHVLPSREPLIFETLKARLKPGDTFLDAGANIGIYTVMASQLVGNQGQVVAIEMIPDTAACLRRNLALNSCRNVVLVEKALSSQSGHQLRAAIPKGKFGKASVAVGHFSESEAKALTMVTIATTSLDEVCADISRVNLMKMDLEGSEPQALRGASAALRKTDAVIFETIHQTDDESARILGEHGFTISRLSVSDSLAIKESRPEV